LLVVLTPPFEKERLGGIDLKNYFNKIPLNPPFSKGEVSSIKSPSFPLFQRGKSVR
jgi:hypothetical protein